ncbi:uncharacterized protein N0V89_010176 [Didymosphaeria variabile]|uniref:NACHT domain-containing protein n=1 Tax=Didymosphaeria variabile TaxID=1932322 RepID=A0A9W8XEQ6_9PLEO|nr:uncharacterized protein N0V89_010176 [Didymosphaeria variabile]KAJ4348798.1 hypothetical protein N0V89_010176 [Didymosphaeria variabile]
MLKTFSDDNKRLEVFRQAQITNVREELETYRKQLDSAMVLKSDFYKLSTAFDSFISTSAQVQNEEKILESLRYPQMKERPETAVAGKPGSGKSTLMKFICDHPNTKAALEKWSTGKNLTTVSFFFWNYGTSKQKSLEGLLQTLLYEILKRFPDAISPTLPLRWKSRVQDLWTQSELLQTFLDLKGNLNSSTCCCFFIDGLDEYTGNPEEVVDVLNVLSSMENIKICVASRPWPIFQKSFGCNETRRLYVQNLTKTDIALYVQDRLAANPTFAEASQGDSRYAGLVAEIVSASQGVFLWVFLVIRSLLEGITNEDTLRTLEKRLRKIPKDLNHFFKHILNGIDEVYQMARTIMVSLLDRKPHFLLIYWFIDELEENPDYVLEMPARKATGRTIMKIESKMERRLAARTKGLLEVQKGRQSTYNIHKVTFLHRTVADFLSNYNARGSLDRLAGPSFQPETSICHAIVGLVDLVPDACISSTTRQDLFNELRHYAYHAKLDLDSPLLALLHRRETAVNTRERSESPPEQILLRAVRL